ncbi:4Fe-4S ferredoxin [Candidatus Magnetoovum chiemensis]|nr:4Fe-4S ferredoxin [Candidatus Magnetoovum chiemensis]
MKGKIEIFSERCKSCNFCVITCPQRIISLSNNFNSLGYFPAYVTDMEKCTGCVLCAEICPEIAIEVWRKED